MKVFRCETCANEMFERRAVCPGCLGEKFTETEAGEPEPLVSSKLTVTPAGFEDSYELIIARLGKTKAIYRKV